MERRVEDGDVPNLGQSLARLMQRVERRPHVQRRELDQLLEVGDDGIVHENGLPEPRAAVDDSVRDGRDVGRRVVEGIDPRRLRAVDNRELQARRACVDD
jgi:hypothetical protein